MTNRFNFIIFFLILQVKMTLYTYLKDLFVWICCCNQETEKMEEIEKKFTLKNPIIVRKNLNYMGSLL